MAAAAILDYTNCSSGIFLQQSQICSRYPYKHNLAIQPHCTLTARFLKGGYGESNWTIYHALYFFAFKTSLVRSAYGQYFMLQQRLTSGFVRGHSDPLDKCFSLIFVDLKYSCVLTSTTCFDLTPKNRKMQMTSNYSYG